MTTEHTCPDCNGAKATRAFADGVRNGKHCGWVETLACFTCKGSGTVSAEQLERIEKGEAMRQDRIARGASLRDEAKRLGISAGELSDLENGRE